MRNPLLVCIAVCVLALAGCGPGGPQTAQELAAALKEHGVAYDVSETAALPRIRADGLRLRGEGLEVEIYCIEDEGELELASTAAMMAVAGQSQTAQGVRLRPYVKKPFLVIVRREPQPDQVRSALDQAFPE